MKGLGLYLNRPSCNHIKFSNEAPINSIMKITDVYKCSTEIKGSWWLVAGPDQNNECLATWAFLKGTGRNVIGQTQHMRMDINKERVCMNGIILRDDVNCTVHIGESSADVTFILKDPRGNLHRENIDHMEPIDKVHRFTMCGKRKDDELLSASQSSFSIKNNCKTPYCSKLVTDWTPVEQENLKTLAYLTIKRDLFDPI